MRSVTRRGVNSPSPQRAPALPPDRDENVIMGRPNRQRDSLCDAVTFSSGAAWGYLAAGVILAALYVWLIWLAARRHRGSARWVLAVLFVLTVAAALVGLPENFRERRIDLVIDWLQVLAEAVALVLIFTGNARDWFAPSSAS
jgi:hypothetical protein